MQRSEKSPGMSGGTLRIIGASRGEARVCRHAPTPGTTCSLGPLLLANRAEPDAVIATWRRNICRFSRARAHPKLARWGRDAQSVRVANRSRP